MTTVTNDSHLLHTAERRSLDAAHTADRLANYLSLRQAALSTPTGWAHDGATDGRLLAQIDALQLQLQDIRNLVVRA